MKKYLGISVISTALVAFAFQIPFSTIENKEDQIHAKQNLVIETNDTQSLNYNEPGEVIDFPAETD